MKYITTPIYYTNDLPHIAHAYTTLAADIVARFWRLQKQEVFFLTGTDEHGAKIAQAAEAAGKTAQEFVDILSEEFKKSWESLDIRPDGFIRTTDPKHEKVVQHFLQQLYDKGYIYKGEYKGWYCVGCEEFKTETQIGPDHTCPIHLKPLLEVAEETYLFKLTQFRDQLLELVQTDKLKIQPETRKNEVLSFIEKEGLQDVAISRKNVAWGISLPWDTTHTIYVWIDALLNYLSAADQGGPEFERGARPHFPPTLQLIGKDILRFHAIIWPALLLAVDLPLPQELFVHGYFTLGGHKMSKSLGNTISPEQLVARYGIDGARYVLISAIPFGDDGDVSWSRFDTIYQTNLANNLGNLVNRVQTMLERYQANTVPAVEVHDLHLAVVVREVNQSLGDWLKLHEATGAINAHVRELNSYIESNAPWQLAKDNKAQELAQVLATLAENVFVSAALLAPFIPETSAKILATFGASVADIDYATLGERNHTAGKTIRPVAPLFPRLLDKP